MARSRLAAATASATDACTGITSSIDTSRTTRRTCGSGTTTRTHEPQPRAPSRPHQRTQAFGIKKTRTGHVNDQAQPAGIKYRTQHTGNSRGTWRASPGRPPHDRTPGKPAHRKPGPITTTRAHHTPIPVSTRYQPGMPSRSRAAHTQDRHSSPATAPVNPARRQKTLRWGAPRPIRPAKATGSSFECTAQA